VMRVSECLGVGAGPQHAVERRLWHTSSAGQENAEYRPAMAHFSAATDAKHAMVFLHSILDQ
jgi:hypothetical protein